MNPNEVLTAAERAKKYREKNKARVKERNKLRMREARKATKEKRANNPELLKATRKAETERKRDYRQRKKADKVRQQTERASGSSGRVCSVIATYKSPQSFGKAVKKTKTSLPHSPSKQRAVVAKLATDVGFSLYPSENPTDDAKLNAEMVTVKEFFIQPEVSYTCPGLKDEITLWENGQKMKLRKYYLTMFLREAFKLFKDAHPQILMGFSTFCKLRPENVLLLHQTPADQCKCITCENVFLKLSSLHIPYSSDEFWKKILCDDTANSDCWNGVCENCGDGQKVTISEVQLSEHVTWKEWEKGLNGRLMCTVKEGCKGELLECLQKDTGKFAKHVNIKRLQACEFVKDKKDPSVRVLQIDFAMNYSCDYQREVQSALWSRRSVLLFTAASIHKGECQTYVICSDTRTKDKNTVAAFLKHLYAHHLHPNSSAMNNVDEVIWSDGPSSEFKNKFMTFLLKQLSDTYNKPFLWKYTATSHGKGIVDGIGGRAKALVRTAVMSRRANAPVVQNASDFAGLASKLMPATHVMLVKDSEIPRDDRVWDAAEPIRGIKMLHILKKMPGQTIETFYNALSPATFGHEHTCSTDFCPGQWVLVKYDDNVYPGEVVQKSSTAVEVTVMVKAGRNTWKWPAAVDKLWYTYDKVMQSLNLPERVASSSRGSQFIFPNMLPTFM